jgi:hypothetical protein
MRIIDYLNQGRYLKRVTDQQPAIQGHVNYVIEQLAGSGAVDITPTDSSAVVTAYIPVDSNADTFTIDISKLDSSVTELNIDVKDFVAKGKPFKGNKQVWIKNQAGNNVNIDPQFEFPSGTTPSFSAGQEKIDIITLSVGPFEGIYAVATLGYDFY